MLDSSLWVDFTRRKTPSPLRARILQWIMDPRAAFCEPIAFEVLRHAFSQERTFIAAQLSTLPCLATPPGLWQEATQMGQACRAAGVNAGSLDLLIAAVALHHGSQLVTSDAGFEAIAKVTGLGVVLLNRQP